MFAGKVNLKTNAFSSRFPERDRSISFTVRKEANDPIVQSYVNHHLVSLEAKQLKETCFLLDEIGSSSRLNVS